MHREARQLIERLGLAPHPEGGWYRETHRSHRRIAGDGPHPAGRCFSTAIFYLLMSADVSTLHRLRTDEVFHHYAGSALTVHMIDEGGVCSSAAVGPGGHGDARFVLVVPAGTWFGATVDEPDGWALVGCTVAPGFEFDDFEQANRAEMLERYPRHRDLVTRLTR